MTKEKALIMALKIVDTCRRYGGEDRCVQCPFNLKGCIVSDGDGVLPTDWRTSAAVMKIEISNTIERRGHDRD